MDVLHDLLARARKYLWMIIAVPVVLAAAGWLIPVGGETSSYTATTTVELGDYKNPDYNDPEKVVLMLSNAPFYQDRLPGLWKESRDEITSQFKVSVLQDQLVQFSFTGRSEDEASRIVMAITNAFLASDQEQYQKRIDVIERSVDEMNKVKADGDAAVDRLRFMYELQTAALELKPAQLLESVDTDTQLETRAFSSKERAVLGGMIGLTLMFFWVVLPEFVRKNRANGRS